MTTDIISVLIFYLISLFSLSIENRNIELEYLFLTIEDDITPDEYLHKSILSAVNLLDRIKFVDTFQYI